MPLHEGPKVVAVVADHEGKVHAGAVHLADEQVRIVLVPVVVLIARRVGVALNRPRAREQMRLGIDDPLLRKVRTHAVAPY